MKTDNQVRNAIDESLSVVHFDAQDMRSVLRASRMREREPERPVRIRRPLRLDLAFACATLLILVVPLSLFALRAQHTRTTPIVASPGGADSLTQAEPEPRADRIIPTALPAYTQEEREAIRLTRACFEEVCDTQIFSFEEYTVSVTTQQAPQKGLLYAVQMTSIYGNGCSFTALVSLAQGCVVSYSAPRLATVPTYLDTGAPELQAWYDKNGPYLFTWDQAAQAEFSRRYEGGALRTAREGELSAQEAGALAAQAAHESFASMGVAADALACYPMLYAERASTDGLARYVVYCFPQPVTDTLPEPCVTVTFTAAGDGLSVAMEAAEQASPAVTPENAEASFSSAGL